MFVMVINLHMLFTLYIVCDICKMLCATVCVTFNHVVVCINKLILLQGTLSNAVLKLLSFCSSGSDAAQNYFCIIRTDFTDTVLMQRMKRYHKYNSVAIMNRWNLMV
jgi:hypothetical protein